MNRQEEHNRAWLIHAMLEPIMSVERSCYYDRKHDHFFSLSPMHFLMFEDAADALEANYYKSEEVMLKDKLARLRVGDQSIIPIPRLSVKARKAMQVRFVAQFRGMYYYEEMLEVIRKQDESTAIVLEPLLNGHIGLVPMQGLWRECRNRLMEQTLTSFAIGHSINLSVAAIWNVSHKQVEVKVKDTALAAKRWWKLW